MEYLNYVYQGVVIASLIGGILITLIKKANCGILELRGIRNSLEEYVKANNKRLSRVEEKQIVNGEELIALNEKVENIRLQFLYKKGRVD